MSTVPDLSDLSPLRDVISEYGLSAQKSLGQNFLLDQNITDKIARLAGDLKGINVFEIGPGPGGLTRSLLRADSKTVTAIEFDERAVRALEPLKNAAGNRLEVMHGDALEESLLKLAQAPRAIVANLPYNIATPLLILWLRDICEDEGAYVSMTLMFQKEVADRMSSRPNQKSYGRLSVLAQWLCDVRAVYDLPPSAFTPPPKVSSCVVHFVPKKRSGDQPSFSDVEKITAAAFGQRRKMIRSSLKNYMEYMEDLGFDETKRAENLSVDDFVNLAACSKDRP